jgi:hypothetical protein
MRILPPEKSEIRSTKSETISKHKIQNKQEPPKGTLRFSWIMCRVVAFGTFELGD